jgi:hypothetical protein
MRKPLLKNRNEFLRLKLHYSMASGLNRTFLEVKTLKKNDYMRRPRMKDIFHNKIYFTTNLRDILLENFVILFARMLPKLCFLL